MALIAPPRAHPFFRVGAPHRYDNHTLMIIFIKFTTHHLYHSIKPPNMVESTHEIEIRIQNAINAYQHDRNQKVTKIAREFQVPYQRLLRRLHRIPSKLDHQPVNKTLDEHQEKALKDWVIHLDDTHYAPTVKQIEGCANSILAWSHEDLSQPPPQVSKMWAYRFIKKLPLEYRRRKQKPMDPRRLNSEDISTVVTWYERLYSLINRYQLQPKDIYNFDEIGFLEGQGRTQAVVTRNSERNENLPSSFSRNSLTIIECISADGSVLPPCIIFKGKEMMEDWFTHSNMPESWMLTTSSAGFTTDRIAYQWIQHFSHFSAKRGVSEPSNHLFNTYHQLTFIYLLGWPIPSSPNG